MSTAQDLEWRQAAWGFSRYEVSNRGDVRAWHSLWGRWHTLRPQINPKGYVTFNLYRDDGVRREVRVHRLVMETFVGPMPAGLEIRHLDDVKTNNHISNLAYGTRAENVNDRIKNGVWTR